MVNRCRYCHLFYRAYVHDPDGEICAECYEWPSDCNEGTCDCAVAVAG